MTFDHGHAHVLNYEPDTAVVDVDEVPPVRSRTVTDGAMTMQVLIDGKHHRRMPDLSETSCGKRIETQFQPVRREELDDTLCDVCFTWRERTKGKAIVAKRNEGTL